MKRKRKELSGKYFVCARAISGLEKAQDELLFFLWDKQ